MTVQDCCDPRSMKQFPHFSPPFIGIPIACHCDGKPRDSATHFTERQGQTDYQYSWQARAQQKQWHEHNTTATSWLCRSSCESALWNRPRKKQKIATQRTFGHVSMTLSNDVVSLPTVFSQSRSKMTLESSCDVVGAIWNSIVMQQRISPIHVINNGQQSYFFPRQCSFDVSHV
jgi:hypothetical protein